VVPPSPWPRRPERSSPYHRTTVYLTQQRQWLRQIAARARLDDLTFSASDAIRLALDRLKSQMSEDELRPALEAHVEEAQRYPGRISAAPHPKQEK